jgi:mycothiol synthase
MLEKITIRNHRPDDLAALVALINAADAVDKQERATTLAEMEHEMSFPTERPETDCFLAWDGDRLAGWTNLYVRPGDGLANRTIYCWGVVHPRWRRRGLGRRLLERAYQRATEYLPGIGEGVVNFQCNTRDVEQGRRALFEGFGLEPVRYWVNLVRPLNGDLPPVELPAGIRLRTLDPERDVEAVWRVDNAAFRDHWDHADGKLEEFQHWIERPHIRPELLFLAEDEATGQIVGLGLNEINPDRIAQTGRREGYIDTVAVLRSHRRRGLGGALLAQSLHALSQSGMDTADLDADTENLTGAMRLYERLGFQVRRTSISYRRVMREA